MRSCCWTFCTSIPSCSKGDSQLPPTTLIQGMGDGRNTVQANIVSGFQSGSLVSSPGTGYHDGFVSLKIQNGDYVSLQCELHKYIWKTRWVQAA